MTWTQAICNACWVRKSGAAVPHRLKEAYRERETCCYCGSQTMSGIYVRANPADVPFPRKEKR